MESQAVSKITHVSIQIRQGGHNMYPIDHFVNMPFEERMKIISEKRIVFLNAQGQTQPLLEGVRYVCDLLRDKAHVST